MHIVGITGFVLHLTVLINDDINIVHSCYCGQIHVDYTLFHENVLIFFSNIIGLLERRNKRKSVLEITKMYYFKI